MVKRERGFTLIEIVLVLALTAVVMVMVFVALSGAQKNRRDTQRKQDLARIAALIEHFAGQQLGRYPTNTDISTPSSLFNTMYNTLDPRDPSANVLYPIGFNMGTACSPNAAIGANGPGAVTYVTPGANNYPYTLRMCLEGGGEFYIGN